MSLHLDHIILAIIFIILVVSPISWTEYFERKQSSKIIKIITCNNKLTLMNEIKNESRPDRVSWDNFDQRKDEQSALKFNEWRKK